MNLTVVLAAGCLAAWLLLVFVGHHGEGVVQLLWAAAAILAARRILVGAPKFLS